MSTNVYITNNVNALTLSNAMGGDLSGSDYSFITTSIPAMTQTEYLEFNRNEGIKDGSTYTFTTTFTFGYISFEIFISLTGTFSSSNYYIQATATSPDYNDGNSVSTQEVVSDGTPYSINTAQTINGTTYNYQVTVERFLPGGDTYDNAYVTISPM